MDIADDDFGVKAWVDSLKTHVLVYNYQLPFKTYLVDAIPATQKAAVRARRAARKRPTKATKSKATKSKATKAKATKSKATKSKTKKAVKEIVAAKRPNPFARFLSLDQNNPAVRTLKNTFMAMENRRLSLTKKK